MKLYRTVIAIFAAVALTSIIFVLVFGGMETADENPRTGVHHRPR